MAKGDTTTTSEPPKWAEPLFEKSADVAMRLYKDNEGFHSYPGETTVNPSAATQQGIQGLIDTANSDTLGNAPIGLANSVFSNGGLSSGARGAAQSLYQGEQGPTAAQQYLTGMANGDMLNGDPYFQNVLERETQKTADAVNRQFAGAGRYGSGVHQGTLADSIGDMRMKALSDNYGRERGYQMQAIQGLMGDENSRASRRLANVQAGAGIESQGLNNALGYIGALPTMQENRVFDENLKLQAGSMQDQQAQADLNDRIRKFTEQDMRGWTRLGALQAAASGSAGPYGMTTTSQQTGFNPLSLLSGIFGMFM